MNKEDERGKIIHSKSFLRSMRTILDENGYLGWFEVL